MFSCVCLDVAVCTCVSSADYVLSGLQREHTSMKIHVSGGACYVTLH